MPRRNDRVRRANDKDRRARELAKNLPVQRRGDQPRIQVEDLVIPDGSCRLQGKPKASFATREKADRALAQAQHERARKGTGHVEKRVYRCPEGGCGGWHLTSRETYEPRGGRS